MGAPRSRSCAQLRPPRAGSIMRVVPARPPVWRARRPWTQPGCWPDRGTAPRPPAGCCAPRSRPLRYVRAADARELADVPQPRPAQRFSRCWSSSTAPSGPRAITQDNQAAPRPVMVTPDPRGGGLSACLLVGCAVPVPRVEAPHEIYRARQDRAVIEYDGVLDVLELATDHLSPRPAARGALDSLAAGQVQHLDPLVHQPFRPADAEARGAAV